MWSARARLSGSSQSWLWCGIATDLATTFSRGLMNRRRGSAGVFPRRFSLYSARPLYLPHWLWHYALVWVKNGEPTCCLMMAPLQAAACTLPQLQQTDVLLHLFCLSCLFVLIDARLIHLEHPPISKRRFACSGSDLGRTLVGGWSAPVCESAQV